MQQLHVTSWARFFFLSLVIHSSYLFTGYKQHNARLRGDGAMDEDDRDRRDGVGEGWGSRHEPQVCPNDASGIVWALGIFFFFFRLVLYLVMIIYKNSGSF